MGVKRLEVARVQEVEGAGLLRLLRLLGSGSLRLEPVSGWRGLGLLGRYRLELLVVEGDKRLNSLGLLRLLRLLGEHSLLPSGLLRHSLREAGRPQGSLRPLDRLRLLRDRLRLLLDRLGLGGNEVLLESELGLAGHGDRGGLGPGHLGGLEGGGGGCGRGSDGGGEGEALEVIKHLEVWDPDGGVDHLGGHFGSRLEPAGLSGGLRHGGGDLHGLDSLGCLSPGSDDPAPGARGSAPDVGAASSLPGGE